MRRKTILPFLTTLLVFGLVFTVLLANSREIGVTWDEPAYIEASESYVHWLQQAFSHPEIAFRDNILTNAWSLNSEHPPLDKVWSGLVWSVARNFTDDLTAHRMGNMLLSAALAAMLFAWLRSAYGSLAGAAGVLALFSMPRFFFHAHLSALDVPAAFSAFLSTFVFWKLLEKRGWAWGLLAGLVWGLALATKVNAVFVPIVLGAWLLLFRREPRQFLRLVIMGLVAVLVFFAAWPWLYQHTLERLITYIGFITVNHWQIGQYYLGQFHIPPPWHFSFVMLWAVIPLGITLLYFVGIGRSFKWKKDNALGALFLLSAFIPVLVPVIGRSLLYDNDRMMMAVYPFLAALAGVGFNWLASAWRKTGLALRSKTLRTGGVVLLAGLALLPQLVGMARLYPHLLSYYSEGVGGLRGATKMGLETTYWCETYSLALPVINAQAKPGDRIWADPWSHDVLIYYQRIGSLREDVVVTADADDVSIFGQFVKGYPMSAADWYIFEHRQTTFGPAGMNSHMLAVLNRQEVVYEYRYEGVPILTVYK